MFTPTISSDANVRLAKLVKQIIVEKNPPVIMINLRPSFDFNILHAIYLLKVKQCIDLGFNCVMIIYDKTIEKRNLVPSQEIQLFNEVIMRNINWFKRAGITEENTEIFTESDLWSIIEFREFAEVVTSFAHIFKINPEAYSVEGNGIVSKVMSNLCEIYYEYFLKSDVILIGESDANEIWRTLRTSGGKIIDGYVSPLVLYYPMLNGIDGNKLSIISSKNSISTSDTKNDIESKIKGSPEAFLEVLIDYFIIPWKKVLTVEKKHFCSFEELKQEFELSTIQDLIIEYTNEYFSNISSA